MKRVMAEINAQYRLTKGFLQSENTFPAGERRQMRIVCRICEFAKEIDLERARLEAENNTLRERIRELEIVEESLGRNIADTAFCPLCLIKDCPQYHKGDLGMGAFDPESVDREQCKKSILAHAEKGAKEFVNGQRTS